MKLNIRRCWRRIINALTSSAHVHVESCTAQERAAVCTAHNMSSITQKGRANERAMTRSKDITGGTSQSERSQTVQAASSEVGCQPQSISPRHREAEEDKGTPTFNTAGQSQLWEQSGETKDTQGSFKRVEQITHLATCTIKPSTAAFASSNSGIPDHLNPSCSSINILLSESSPVFSPMHPPMFTPPSAACLRCSDDEETSLPVSLPFPEALPPRTPESINTSLENTPESAVPASTLRTSASNAITFTASSSSTATLINPSPLFKRGLLFTTDTMSQHLRRRVSLPDMRNVTITASPTSLYQDLPKYLPGDVFTDSPRHGQDTPVSSSKPQSYSPSLDMLEELPRIPSFESFAHHTERDRVSPTPAAPSSSLPSASTAQPIQSAISQLTDDVLRVSHVSRNMANSTTSPSSTLKLLVGFSEFLESTMDACKSMHARIQNEISILTSEDASSNEGGDDHVVAIQGSVDGTSSLFEVEVYNEEEDEAELDAFCQELWAAVLTDDEEGDGETSSARSETPTDRSPSCDPSYESSYKESSPCESTNGDSDADREATALEALEEGFNQAFPWLRWPPKYDDETNRRPTYPSSANTQSSCQPVPCASVFVPPPPRADSWSRCSPKYDDETNRRPTYASSANTQSCFEPRPPVFVPPPQKVDRACPSPTVPTTATSNGTAEGTPLSVPSPSGTGTIICPKPTPQIPLAALLERSRMNFAQRRIVAEEPSTEIYEKSWQGFRPNYNAPPATSLLFSNSGPAPRVAGTQIRRCWEAPSPSELPHPHRI
ncbi:hypothetical protein CVT24_000665 [Panaeolus cyanescens]|uniref:Uncharacterized protein n=1 Tax=Panaeolus cyanescens TaxID=181874 RepID=A0A409W751_9AGAR|nr:hypothetical protein CVT24_000665 [Panaeolus cyanescens]